jgi:hypothetical protein
MDRRRNLPVADRNGRLICYSASRLARLCESFSKSRTRSIMEPDDQGDATFPGLDLQGPGGNGGNGGGDHVEDLQRAAAKIFGDKTLSPADKLKKLRLLLRVLPDDVPDDDEAPGADLPAEINSAEGVIRKMWRRCRRMPRDPRPAFVQQNPGAGALPGLLAIAEGNGQLPRGSAVRLVESARRRGPALTAAKFLEALERGGR